MPCRRRPRPAAGSPAVACSSALRPHHSIRRSLGRQRARPFRQRGHHKATCACPPTVRLSCTYSTVGATTVFQLQRPFIYNDNRSAVDSASACCSTDSWFETCNTSLLSTPRPFYCYAPPLCFTQRLVGVACSRARPRSSKQRSPRPCGRSSCRCCTCAPPQYLAFTGSGTRRPGPSPQRWPGRARGGAR